MSGVQFSCTRGLDCKSGRRQSRVILLVALHDRVGHVWHCGERCHISPLRASNATDVRNGEGVYLTEITARTLSVSQLSRRLLGVPWLGRLLCFDQRIAAVFPSSPFIADLEQLDRIYGPKPGRTVKPVVLVEDNGPIHVSKITRAALDARKHWLTVEWLPKYAPELNDIEVVWHDLKAHHLAHKTFTDVAALDRDIHAAVDALNQERNVDSLVNRRISA